MWGKLSIITQVVFIWILKIKIINFIDILAIKTKKWVLTEIRLTIYQIIIQEPSAYEKWMRNFKNI